VEVCYNKTASTKQRAYKKIILMGTLHFMWKKWKNGKMEKSAKKKGKA